MEKITFTYTNLDGNEVEMEFKKNLNFKAMNKLIIDVAENIYADGDYMPHLSQMILYYFIIKDYTTTKPSAYYKTVNKAKTINWDYLYGLTKSVDFEDKLAGALDEVDYTYIRHAINKLVDYYISSGRQLKNLQTALDTSMYNQLNGETPFIENEESDVDEV